MTAQLTPGAEAWRKLGSVEIFNKHKVHCFFRDLPSKPEVPLLVFLHGFPTCSYDWSKVIQHLDSNPVLAFDFLGFGLSDKPRDVNYTLSGHADLTLELITRFNDSRRKIFLVSHDMGTSVGAEILARELEGTLPEGIQIVGTLLFNGNMIMEKASLVLGQKLLRTRFGPIVAALSTKRIFVWQFGRAVSQHPPPDDSTYEDQWSLLSFNAGNKLLHKTIQYTFERVTRGERLLGAIRDSKVPLTFAWGMNDPVATAGLQLEGWKELRPSAPVHKIQGCGHYPQLEDPEAFVRVLSQILQTLEI